MIDARIPSPQQWSPPHRFFFRLVFSYLVLFNIPQAGSASIFDVLPWGSGPVNDWLAKPMQPPALWLGNHVFRLQGLAATFHPTGSGDTALNYVLVLLCAALAVLAAVVWTLLDRHRSHYSTLEAWLRLLVSFVVAAALLEYGFAKIFPAQFGPISLYRLNETYGESSPMGLMWTFMSGSRWYTMFGGLAEIVPGLLLFFRRTRTLGALLGGAVLLNVFVLNLCYDIPVKLYSAHLLAMCLYLAWPDLRALMRLFVLREQAQLRTDHVPAAQRRWIRYTGRALLGLLVICACFSSAMGPYQSYPTADTSIPLYGVWRVVHADATSAQVPFLDLIVSTADGISVIRVDGTRFRLSTRTDGTKHTITITSKKFGNSLWQYQQDASNPRHLSLTGGFDHGQLRLELTRRSPDSYPLLTRGFHWINEETPNW